MTERCDILGCLPLVFCSVLRYECVEFQQQWDFEQQQFLQWVTGSPCHELIINKHILNIDSLYEAFLKERKHNRRGNDSLEYEHNLYANLSDLCAQINNREYFPTDNYTFVHRRGSKPREVFAAEVGLKIMMVYIDMRLRHIIEATLSPKTFNNRIGKGTAAAIANVYNDIYEVSEGYTRSDCYIIKYDLKGYFPNLNQDVAYNVMMDKIISQYDGEDKDDIIYMTQVACYCNPQDNCYRKSPLSEWYDIPDYKSLLKKPRGIGGAIGFLWWQTMSNLYQTDIDNFITSEVCKHYTRFVDDEVLITSDKDRVLSYMPILRQKYAEIGVTMHPRKFYCQQYYKGVEYLGFHIKPNRIYLNNRVIRRAIESADKPCDLETFLCRTNSYLGLMKVVHEYKNAIRYINHIKRNGVFFDYKDLKAEKACKKKDEVTRGDKMLVEQANLFLVQYPEFLS